MGGLQRVQARRRPRLGGVGVERRAGARVGAMGERRGRSGSGSEPAPGSVGVGVGGERRGAARAGLRRRDGGRESVGIWGKRGGMKQGEG